MIKSSYLIAIIFSWNIIKSFSFSLNHFSKSLYTSINEDKEIDLKNIKSNSKIDSDYLIMKYEESLNNFKGSLNNRMSLFINSKYYHKNKFLYFEKQNS